MSSKEVVLNPGAQREFVLSEAEAAAYIGGIGSGKTFAGIVKGLLMSQQPLVPGALFGPRGAIGASSNPVLKRIVLPQFFEIMEGADLWKTGRRATSYVKSEYLARLIANCGCPDPHVCNHESQIYLATLDDPDEIRGMELSWAYIDEGRNTTLAAWDVLWGRMRQQGYAHQIWVCSTPNGFDWMYDLFHPESPTVLKGAEWYTAASMDNMHHTGEDYIRRLRNRYAGRYFEQEVLGHFVGMTAGAVFFEWDPAKAVGDVPFRSDLPLYSEWDFGMGDLNVVNFFQVDWRASDGVHFPVKRYIGALEGNNMTSGDWATRYKQYAMERFGQLPKEAYGDPAGRQRNQVTGTSVISDLKLHGVNIVPAPKMPVDHAVRILNNMMALGDVLVDATHCERLTKAFASHKWPTNAAGNKTQNTPVHDWTSHYCDAARYGTTVAIPMEPVLVPDRKVREFQPNEVGYVVKQILTPPPRGHWIGRSGKPKTPDWNPGILTPRVET